MKKKDAILVVFLVLFVLGIFVQGEEVGAKERVSVPTVFRARSSQQQYIRVQWKKVPKADGYQIYQYRVQEKKFVRVAEVGKNRTTWVSKKTKTKKTYKIRAYREISGRRVYSKFSYEVSAIPYKKNAKKVNAGSVISSHYNLKIGLFETVALKVNIKASKYAKNKKATVVDSALRWYTTDRNIVAVDENGVVKTQGKAGKCQVYARAHNGNYTGKINVTVVDFARPNKFKDVEYMQDDMKKMVAEYGDEIKEIAYYFDKERANNRKEDLQAVFSLNGGRTDIKADMIRNEVPYEQVKDRMFRLMDSFPGKMEIEVDVMAIHFILYGKYTRVEIRFGFYQSYESKELIDGEYFPDLFKIAPRWYYSFTAPGV